MAQVEARIVTAGAERNGLPVTNTIPSSPEPTGALFFKRYNRIIGTTYAAILLGLALFFAYQLREKYDQEVGIIREHVQRHAQFLEFILSSSADEIETLRLTLATQFNAASNPLVLCPVDPERSPQLVLREEQGGFNHDAIADRDSGGNIVGRGSLRDRSVLFYCDLAATFTLNAALQALNFNLPNAARAHFISVHDFHLIFPWRPATERPFNEAMKRSPVWERGLPAVNPERRKYWAPAFFAGEDVGLLVPIGAPVYDGQRFMGVVSIDIGLDYLNRINSDFGYPLGVTFVIDAQGEVLAHPRLYADTLKVRQPFKLEQVFGQAGAPSPQASLPSLQTVPAASITHRDGHLIYRHSFISAPWQLVFTLPEKVLWRKLAGEYGPGMLAVLVGLALLMAATYWVSSREFVHPAAQLVTHLAAESRFRPQPMPRVPVAWRPWFDAITHAFRESLQLSSLRREVDIAARVQQSILPSRWPKDQRFQLWGTMLPAKDVGGDFYDHFSVRPDSCDFIVADVSGKGISAGLFGVMSKTLMRSMSGHAELSLGMMMARVNQGLCEDNDACMFVTAFHGRYIPNTGELSYVNAGHPPPLLVHADGTLAWLASSENTALGVMEDLQYSELHAQLLPGDTLLVYSDGVSEAMNAQNEEFGTSRLAQVFAGNAPKSSSEAVSRVLEAVAAYAHDTERSDDITCVALHRNFENHDDPDVVSAQDTSS